MMEFQNCLLAAFNACFPTRVVRLRSTDPPWVKPYLKILINKRDRAHMQGKFHKYVRLRNEVISYVKQLKSQYIDSVISSRKSTELWKTIKNFGRCQKINHNPIRFSPDVMCDYFLSTFSRPTPDDYDIRELDLSVFDLPKHPLNIAVCEVEHLLRTTKKKCAGPDELPYWLFKRFSSILAPCVTQLFNRMFKDCHVPDCLKRAIVSPIPKCAMPTDPSQYRPISLLPIISKSLEKLVANHWIKPYIRHEMKSDQFAYTPGIGKGTVPALTLLLHNILNFLDKQSGAVRVLTVDFSRAFDKLPFSSIISAAIKFGLPKECIMWITSFLTDRQFCVRTNSTLSKWTNITSGVPQGSVLGPLLFCMAMNSLSPVCGNTRLIKYADDITYLHFVRVSEEDALQKEWDHLSAWSTEIGLPINRSKCFIMDVVTKKDLNLTNIKDTDGNNINTSEELKLLGLFLNADLRWNAHIDYVKSKAGKRFYLLHQLRRSGCPPKVIQQAYTALILPLFTYGFPAFCNAPLYLLQKIESLERRALRIVGGDPSAIFPQAAARICDRMFDQIAMEKDHPLRELFLNRELTPRNQCPLRPPLARTNRFKQSFIRYCK